MTLRFLTEFRSDTTCFRCKAAPAENRKTCPEHLAYAREQFRVWAAKRRRSGMCLACDRRGYRGECRCLLHKGRNQERCRTWMRTNSDWAAFRSAFERLWLKLDGVCRYCRRLPAADNRVGCQGCLDRHGTHGERGVRATA